MVQVTGGGRTGVARKWEPLNAGDNVVIQFFLFLLLGFGILFLRGSLRFWFQSCWGQWLVFWWERLWFLDFLFLFAGFYHLFLAPFFFLFRGIGEQYFM